MYAASIADPDAFWAEQGKRHRLDQALHQGQEHLLRDRTTSRSAGSRTAHQRRLQLRRPPPRDARRPGRDHLGGRRPRRVERKITYRELHERGLPLRQRPARRAASGKGDRVTIYLPMIPEAAYAMLACARIGAVHSVVFGGFSPDSLAGRIEDCAVDARHHRRRGPARRPEGPAQGQRRRGAATSAGGVDHVLVVRAHRRAPSPCRPAATSDYDEAAEGVPADCPAEEMNAEDPLFILYTSGSTGQAEGRAAHHRRLSRLRLDDAPLRLRLPRRRHLLVHRRRRLGHRPLLHRLRPARQRRDDADVRGRADLPHASRRFWEVVDKHKVNIFYTAPTAIRALMQAGDDAGEDDLARLAAPARLGRRADQSGGLGVVSPRRRRRPLPDRRHLVADRDRRHPDHPAARRDRR